MGADTSTANKAGGKTKASGSSALELSKRHKARKSHHADDDENSGSEDDIEFTAVMRGEVEDSESETDPQAMEAVRRQALRP